jgi:hypothetical protein
MHFAAAAQMRAPVGQDNPFSAPGATVPAQPPAEAASLKASQSPALSIPVAPLGFAAPGAYYLGQRNSLVSLDFLDENRLLFTFRVPGLMRRDASSTENEERQIRAVVLALPSGAVLSEALWTLHDRARYLWPLANGQFLVRDGNEIRQGDASLELKPVLRFPGPLLSLQMDPSQHFLVANSREPAAEDKSAEPPPRAAKTSDYGFEGEAPATRDFMVRILRRDSGQVLLYSRMPNAVPLPINSDGYLESQRGRGLEWSLYLNHFSGGRTALGQVISTCGPTFDFLTGSELLATLCDTLGGHKLAAIATDGRHLWENFAPENAIWPLLVPAANGSRLARESVLLSHPLSARMPFSTEEVRGQLVEVFDAADGRRALTVQAAPVFDAGGNVAFSPSGRRVAVLTGGAIQIFDLPGVSPLPDVEGNHFGR